MGSKVVAIAVVLFLLRFILGYIASVTETLEAVPVWVPIAFQGGAQLTSIVMALLVVVVIVKYGQGWIKGLLDWLDASSSDESEAPASTNEASQITRDLARTVNDLNRYGDKAAGKVQSAKAQTQALVDIAKALQLRSAEQGRIAHSLAVALDAIATREILEIKKAAGQVQDEHLRSLMLINSTEANKAYWENIAQALAVQLGNAQRWSSDYEILAGQLIAEISDIKTRLTAATAQIALSEAARPLLEARVNLDEAARVLRLPVNEIARPDQLQAPRNEYALIG